MTDIKKSTTSNMTDLRNKLLAVFDEVRADDISLTKAKEMANVAGKIIKSCAVQVEYAAARKETPDIPFLK